MELANVTLDDKYLHQMGRVYLTGIQALVRLLLDQHQRDRDQNLNTAGFVSGYRGSPLGGLDQNLWKAQSFLQKQRIHFQPGLNEDLAATAVWGTQQVNMFEGARYDGVFGMWYGKAPGVDRSGDVFKHANAAGCSQFGGVLAIAGDDHGCKSSTLPSQSEFSFMDARIPVLNPADVQEVLDFGLYGYAMSRFSGCWVGLKAIADNMDTSESVNIDPQRLTIKVPAEFPVPDGGLHSRWPDTPLQQEERLQQHKLYAALAFARANRLDRIVLDSPEPRLGIVTTGKAYLDVCQALEDLGIDAALATQIGLRVYKVAMSWPLERDGVRHFAHGLEEILVVEEKRAVIENQLKEQLYNWDEVVRPRVVGEFDEHGQRLIPSIGELTPARVARVISQRIGPYVTSTMIKERLEFLQAKEAALAKRSSGILDRTPHFCSGCPHNTSTVVPEGSRALGGIGCHYMATWMNRHTDTFSQMGGEGVCWIGQAPFTETPHVFANLGDGTYFHSGILAIRAALAAKVRMTYKILYNDAVAMTGGQPLDGTLSIPDLTRQLQAEGVKRIELVSETPQHYADKALLAPRVGVHHRDQLATVQHALREYPGVSVLIYDQTCAAEKRRRRKRGQMPDPGVRAFINSDVCEGCGDCSRQSNCLSVIPMDTANGRKRSIDQYSCNMDLSCLKGFCPSFVTVHGGQLRRTKRDPATFIRESLTSPAIPSLFHPFNLLITGIGGTGVTTLAALLGMAAHLEGKGISVLDMTGLAQKYGAVTCHVRIAAQQSDLKAKRISAGNAHLLLGCDFIVAASFDVLAKCDPEHTHAVINKHRSMTAGFISEPDQPYHKLEMQAALAEAVRDDAVFVDANLFAIQLCGDPMATNLFMLGAAWQAGRIPLSHQAIEQAITLNGVAVENNLQAFTWGRLYIQRPQDVSTAAGSKSQRGSEPKKLTELIGYYEDHLCTYQNKSYARRYVKFVQKIADTELKRTPDQHGLAETVAVSYAKLLAYKDEYEVARLFTDAKFKRQLDAQFSGDYKLQFHLAPPLLSVHDPLTGRPVKRHYGDWVLRFMRPLARFKFLRGTPFDPFGYSKERYFERQLIRNYEGLLRHLRKDLTPENHALAVQLAALAQRVRGFGPVKIQASENLKQTEQELLKRFNTAGQCAKR